MIQKFTHLKIRSLILFCSFFISSVFAQTENIGFELGNTTDWTCGSGTYGDTSAKLCDQKFSFLVNYDGVCLNQGGNNSTNTPTIPTINRHTLMTTGTDRNSNFKVSCVAPSNLFPTNVNNYSFRLGNALTVDYINSPITKDTLAHTEGVRFKLLVDASNAKLTYLYSLFINERSPNPGPQHPQNQSPRFIAKVTDSNDSVLKESYREITSENIILQDGYADQGNIWKYTDWTKVSLDLSPYIGQTLTIAFMTGDCYAGQQNLIDTTKCMFLAGAHSAYAYLDLYCESITTTIAAEKKNSVSIELFPNPMSSELNIFISGLSSDTSTQLNMYDYLGKKVKSQQLKNGPQKLYKEDLSNGIYFIEIMTNDQVLEKKKLVIKD